MNKKLTLSLYALTFVALVFATQVTAHIDGVTADFGNTVALDSNGLTIDAGNSSPNQIKFTDGSVIFSSGDSLNLWADTSVLVRGGGASPTVRFGSSEIRTLNNAELDLGANAQRFRDLWLSRNLDVNNDIILGGNLYVSGDIVWTGPPTTSANDYPLVYSTGTNLIYRKTDGFDGTCSNPTSITVERGIITACS